MAKHTQTICGQQRKNYLSMSDHFEGLARKGLKYCKITQEGLKKDCFSKPEMGQSWKNQSRKYLMRFLSKRH